MTETPRVLSYLEAINEALALEMEHDPSVVVFGEDNIGGTGCDGTLGHAWGPTRGLHLKFPDKVFDAPITEAAFVGAAVGAAATGLRPVADLLFVDFAGVCFDQILNQAAKLRYMVGGKAKVPMVLRAMWGTGMRRGAQHSQALYSLFTHIPGLKVIAPSNPVDAKGLMAAAIQDDDPVIFFEHKLLYFGSRGVVPEERYTIPLGVAKTVREGDDGAADRRLVRVGRARLDLPPELGEVGMGRVGRQAGGHPVHPDLLVLEVGEDPAQGFQGDAEVGVRLPAPRVVRGQSAGAQDLDGEAEAHV